MGGFLALGRGFLVGGNISKKRKYIYQIIDFPERWKIIRVDP